MSTGISAEETAVYIGPDADDELAEVVRASGLRLGSLDDSSVVVWTGGQDGFPQLPATVRWVQLPSAGVEHWFDAGLVDAERTWTSAAGAYASTVAEHALALLLAGVRGLHAMAAWTSWRREEAFDLIGTLDGATVAVVGAGGVGRRLITSLAGLGARSVAVNRSGAAVAGATTTFGSSHLHEALSAADHVVVCAPATPETKHLIGAAELALLEPRSWVVNIARGSLIDHDALADAVASGRIGGAGLDVTEPEPLPDGHRLWSLDNVVITPHTANTPPLLRRAFAAHVAANLARYSAGQPLESVIDIEKKY